MKMDVRRGMLGWAWQAAWGLAVVNLAMGQGSSLVTLELLTGDTARRVVIELDEARAPRTCANFRKLIEADYYRGMAVHRIIPNYLVQMGDPFTREPGKKHLWGTGGPGQTLPAELGGKHVRGALAMARLPDPENPRKESNGSQFYVALDDLTQLDGDYTVFGRVVRGIEHLDFISQLTADTNDVPVSRVEIQRSALGGEISDSPSLAGLAVKPVAAAAGGLKDVSKAVASTLPGPGGRGQEKQADAAATVEDAPAEEVEDARRPLLGKLAPSNLAILGRKKEDASAGQEQGVASPMAEGHGEEERRRLLPLGNKGKKAEEAPVASQASGSKKTPAVGTAIGEATPVVKESKEKAEPEKKGIFGRMLDKVR